LFHLEHLPISIQANEPTRRDSEWEVSGKLYKDLVSVEIGQNYFKKKKKKKKKNFVFVFDASFNNNNNTESCIINIIIYFSQIFN
jgi:hypothetical protein